MRYASKFFTAQVRAVTMTEGELESIPCGQNRGFLMILRSSKLSFASSVWPENPPKIKRILTLQNCYKTALHTTNSIEICHTELLIP